jgi:GT2 family glycosyltransferase
VISFIIPTRNRPDSMRRTLSAINRACASGGAEAEVIVIDNASQPPLELSKGSASHASVNVLRVDQNLGTAARNFGAQAAGGNWLIMLDDDSYPLDAGFLTAIGEAPPDVAAIGADIILADGWRERGGLPEVFVGCGAAVRREAFLDAGGYDETFDYYVEEYDLCAKLILRGWRIVHDCRFKIRHEKLAAGRDFNRIVHRLVRNNAWVAQRYAPDHALHDEFSATVSRYAAMAVHEIAADGFARGMNDLFSTLAAQTRTPMPQHLWDRFTGLAHVRQMLLAEIGDGSAFPRVAVVDEGKNSHVVYRAIQELGIPSTISECDADVHVIGTLSPGPMLDAFERRSSMSRPVICGWQPLHYGHAFACAER